MKFTSILTSIIGASLGVGVFGENTFSSSISISCETMPEPTLENTPAGVSTFTAFRGGSSYIKVVTYYNSITYISNCTPTTTNTPTSTIIVG
ncbi:Aga2p SCDLUD_001538 [Saccharomycodes ludwigii]|uniref:Aga2p n=1 Tax=Saccharomycodes ludwigii TaxID=36035 RepID=UPI001E871898|nr:hypothetical protein SCDLUD_001538 [Saccharomycodes ludwigii]KAH3901761.1 hypothetical protein SCDLUD_001538 [Saccharomycodes ludwigii]